MVLLKNFIIVGNSHMIRKNSWNLGSVILKKTVLPSFDKIFQNTYKCWTIKKFVKNTNVDHSCTTPPVSFLVGNLLILITSDSFSWPTPLLTFNEHYFFFFVHRTEHKKKVISIVKFWKRNTFLHVFILSFIHFDWFSQLFTIFTWYRRSQIHNRGFATLLFTHNH